MMLQMLLMIAFGGLVSLASVILQESVSDEKNLENLEQSGELNYKKFENRFEFGKYIASVLKNCSFSKINRDEGLWNYISCFFLEDFISSSSKNNRYLWMPKWHETWPTLGLGREHFEAQGDRIRWGLGYSGYQLGSWLAVSILHLPCRPQEPNKGFGCQNCIKPGPHWAWEGSTLRPHNS